MEDRQLPTPNTSRVVLLRNPQSAANYVTCWMIIQKLAERLLWTEIGDFSVRGAYDLSDHEAMAGLGEASNNHSSAIMWQALWKAQCNEVPETSLHALWSCPDTEKKVRLLILKPPQLPYSKVNVAVNVAVIRDLNVNFVAAVEGTEALKALDISTTYHEQKDARWNPEAFLKMENLKFLRIFGFLHVSSHLPNDLRILDWTLHPSKSLPSSFQLDELIQLCLRQSKIEWLWIGVKLGNSLHLAGCTKIEKFPENLGNFKGLEKLDLSRTAIKGLPSSIEQNLGNVEGLEKLDLSGIAIKDLPSSIGRLTNLTVLTLKDCKNLVCLPNAIWSLKLGNSLDLSKCSKFDNLPENLGNVKGLEKIDLSGTAIKELPSSIEHLTYLTVLTLKDCKNLVRLPNNIFCLKLLKFLDLFGCSKFDNLGENVGNAKGLELLNLSGTAVKEGQSGRLQDILDIIIPGGEILIWFSLERTDLASEGSELPLEGSDLAPGDCRNKQSRDEDDGVGSSGEVNPIFTMAQCSSNNSTVYEDLGVIHHDIDNSAAVGSRNKPSRYEDDGAGTSGEGYFN
nr:putative wrky transcription factor 19 [Quercus suber]